MGCDDHVQDHVVFAVGTIRRGRRWERIGVESAHELRRHAEVEVVVEGSNTTRIAHIAVDAHCGWCPLSAFFCNQYPRGDKKVLDQS